MLIRAVNINPLFKLRLYKKLYVFSMLNLLINLFFIYIEIALINIHLSINTFTLNNIKSYYQYLIYYILYLLYINILFNYISIINAGY